MMSFQRLVPIALVALLPPAALLAQAPEKVLSLPIVDKAIEFHGGDLWRWCAETSVRRGPGHRDGRRGMIST